MRPLKTALAAISAVGILVPLMASTAEAAPRCRPAVAGSAASLGMFGVGSATARAAARGHWESNAYNAYGSRYASFYKARAVRWSCKAGFIAPAKCVVWAKPCRY